MSGYNRKYKDEDSEGFRPAYPNKKRYNKKKFNTTEDKQYNKYEKKEDIPFSIKGYGQKARERMIDNINMNLDNSPDINITKLISFYPDITQFISKTTKQSLNLEFWDNITTKTLLNMNINFIDDKIPTTLTYADYHTIMVDTLNIKQNEFVNLITNAMFRNIGGMNFINQSITIANGDFNISTEDSTIKNIGVITYALHNDTPDCRIKYFELMKVVMYNMLNLFVQGYAGEAYLFRINPQGSRICFEYHYNLDDWRLLMSISRYFNEIFKHVICTGWKFDINKAYMKYEFIRYVKTKK